jgi:hypothetical protein
MTIDIESIRQEFIRIAEQTIGDQLSSPDAVYIARDDFPVEDYPYVVFDILSMEDTGSWLLYQGVDSETGDISYISHTKMLLQYTFKGLNSLKIANDFRNFFKIERILDEIYKNTGGQVEQVLAIDSIPDKLATSFLESASLNIIFNIEDKIVEPESLGGVITRVDLGGEFKKE